MPPSIGWVLTVPLVMRCRGEFPMIALHVVEGVSGHVTEWLSTGRIDIGVVYNAPRLPSLLTEPLLEESLVFARSGRRSGQGWQRSGSRIAAGGHSADSPGPATRSSAF